MIETEEDFIEYLSNIEEALNAAIEMNDARAFIIIKNVQANILEKIKEWKPNIKHL